jgi:membrane protein YdbS with pleckstrin-like domain
MLRIDKNVIKAERLSGCIDVFVFAVITAVISWLVIHYDWPKWIIVVVVTLTLLSISFEIILSPRFMYEYWRYRISEHEVELQHGVFFKKHTLIPMARIQHIDTKQGPIQRFYGLYSISIWTAAGSYEIPALKEETAEKVRKQISYWRG